MIEKPWFSAFELYGPCFEKVPISISHLSRYKSECLEIGGWFKSGNTTPSTSALRVISPYHGRSAVARLDTHYVSVKGVGWTWSKPFIMRSRKDQQLTFGLMSLRDAIREAEVNDYLRKTSGTYAKILGFGVLQEIIVDNHRKDIQNVVWTNGESIKPTLLYTLQKSPVRVGDLTCLSDMETRGAIAKAAKERGWSLKDYLSHFSKDLGKTIASLHIIGGVNDTLEPGNVTLCAEVTDFEWIYVPGINHPWPDADQYLEVRQSKELVYAVELITILAARLNKNHHEHIKLFLQTYLDEGGCATQGAHELQVAVTL